MIIRIEDLIAPCTTILSAVDSNELSQLTKTLELKVKDGILFMSVTNKEYFAEIKINIGEDVDFHATVDADTFLKLISKTTTDVVEFDIVGNSLVIKGNGVYKLPLIFDDDKLLEIPVIEISNVTQEFDIEGDILNSLLTYNSKQLSTGVITKPVQKYYFVDNEGALTFTSGACVNKFSLAGTVKMLLSGRVVKLFKLFKDKVVHFKFGCDEIASGITQTKVSFEANDIKINVILQSDESLLNSVPVAAIRGRADTVYPYSVSLNRQEILNTVERIGLFTTTATLPYVTLEFGVDKLQLFDYNKENSEDLYYNNKETGLTEKYSSMLDVTELKSILDSCSEEYITCRFGDKQAMIMCRGNVTNIIPEIQTASISAE